jgi:hypothetical protein
MKHTAQVMIAMGDEEYARCAEYCAEHGSASAPMTFPTLYLLGNDGEIKGVISRRPSTEAVMVGRAVANSGLRLVQLAEAFEKFLKRSGVTQYLIPVSRGTELERLLGKFYNEPPYAQDRHHSWWKRVIGIARRA